jgi:gamma-glutamylputrescine oxidase
MPSLPNAPPDAHSRPSIPGDAGPMPARAEVAVVGDGVAALRVAEGLATAGADVALLAPSTALGSVHDSTAAGLVTPGLAEHPHRLSAAIGAQGAAALHRWTLDGARLLGTHLDPRPAVRASAGRGEDDDISSDLAIAAGLGLAAVGLDAGEVAGLVGSRAFGTGWRVDGYGAVHPSRALADLAALAHRAGARLLGGCPITRLEDGDEGVRLITPRGALLADVVVLAGDWRMRDIDPWCADKVGPVRHHLARYAAPPGVPPRPVTFTAQHGWLQARIDRDGALIISGARWASPHFETGEAAAQTSETVLTALDGLVAQRFGPWHAAGRTHAWASIAAHTCDQLPIIGPLPGRSCIVACFGWNGRPWSMAARAADAVVDGLLHGRAEGVSRWVQAHRFV